MGTEDEYYTKGVDMSNAMEEISSKDARNQMSEILSHVAFQGKHYLLTRNGKGMAVIISLEEWKAYEQLLQKQEDEEDIRDADAAMEYINNGGKTISHEQMKKELGL
jgi:prevent-host-death family protein